MIPQSSAAGVGADTGVLIRVGTAPVELHVRGTAHLEVAPDYAEAHVSILGRDAEQAVATGRVQSALADLRTALEGVRAVVHLDLSQLTVTQEYTWDDSTRTQVPGQWIGRVAGTVRIQAESANEVLPSLLGSGAQLDYVSWMLDPDNSAYRQARTAAVHDAARAADDFAAAVGQPLGPLISLSDPGMAPVGAPIARAHSLGATADDGAASNIDLMPAPITVSAEVNAVFHTG